jgi:cell division protein FtsW
VGAARHRDALGRDARRLPHYREPAFIWTGLGSSPSRWSPSIPRAVNGARRWFGIGGIGVQPSELAKLVAIFFIAALLERRMHRIDELTYSLLPIGIVVLGLVALILPSPISAPRCRSLLIAAVMVFAAGLNYRYIVGVALSRCRRLHRRDGLGVPPPAHAGVPQSLGRPARRRLSDHPVADRGRHRRRLGQGLMNGVQKLFYLPEPHTDFIYSVIAEELGLIGATAVLSASA